MVTSSEAPVKISLFVVTLKSEAVIETEEVVQLIGTGTGSPVAAFSLRLNVRLTIDQTKRGRATTRPNIIPKLRRRRELIGRDLNLLMMFILHIRSYGVLMSIYN